MLDTACAPEGREGRSQAGPKGHQLEVGARRAPKLLVFNISFCLHCKRFPLLFESRRSRKLYVLSFLHCTVCCKTAVRKLLHNVCGGDNDDDNKDDDDDDDDDNDDDNDDDDDGGGGGDGDDHENDYVCGDDVGK